VACGAESHGVRSAIKVALLGAESTGKTQLAHDLAQRMHAQGHTAIAIDEYLRQWCETHGRTPRQDEQAHIAAIQRQRIEQAAQTHEWVFADTTPLMTAVYSEFIFSDTALHTDALAYQRSFDLTFVTGLDMPWEADGLQRDGAHVRAPVDTLLRQLLQQDKLPYQLVYGLGEARLDNAWHALESLIEDKETIKNIAASADSMPENSDSSSKKWVWRCDKCSDPECEHRLFRDLIKQG
jgi:nicotinamide riboside kinase